MRGIPSSGIPRILKGRRRHMHRAVLSLIVRALAIGTSLGVPEPSRAGVPLAVDAASPVTSGGTIRSADVLGSGPVVVTAGSNIGLTPGADFLNDFSYGQESLQVPRYYSVDRTAHGLPGTVPICWPPQHPPWGRPVAVPATASRRSPRGHSSERAELYVKAHVLASNRRSRCTMAKNPGL